jgi:hypothetical protein
MYPYQSRAGGGGRPGAAAVTHGWPGWGGSEKNFRVVGCRCLTGKIPDAEAGSFQPVLRAGAAL